MEDTGAPGLIADTAGADEAPVAGAVPRFTLYDDDGIFGVFDSAGPQVSFSETRERAQEEVIRANAIVERFPDTISMAHLREMDGQWRSARGLPQLPEPEGPRLIVEDWMAGGPTPTPPMPTPAGGPRRAHTEPVTEAASATARLASEVVAIRAALERADAASALADRSVLLASSLARATVDAHEPLLRLRTALGDVFGEHAPAAEIAFRQIVLRDGPEAAVRTLRGDPRALLTHPQPRTLPGGVRARESAAAVAAGCAPMIARLDHVLRETASHAGIEPAVQIDPATAARLLRVALPAQQRTAAEARAHFHELSATPVPIDQLRSAWTALGPDEQAAVRRAVPEVDQILTRPGRARARGGPEL